MKKSHIFSGGASQMENLNKLHSDLKDKITAHQASVAAAAAAASTEDKPDSFL